MLATRDAAATAGVCHVTCLHPSFTERLREPGAGGEHVDPLWKDAKPLRDVSRSHELGARIDPHSTMMASEAVARDNARIATRGACFRVLSAHRGSASSRLGHGAPVFTSVLLAQR
jgi:hypothetical protein